MSWNLGASTSWNPHGLDGPVIESRWEARFSAPVQTGPGAHPASCTMGTGSFPGVKSSRGVMLTPHPLLVPWSKSRAILLLPLWAVRPVQSLSACTRVHFTFFYLQFSTTRRRRRASFVKFCYAIVTQFLFFFGGGGGAVNEFLPLLIIEVCILLELATNIMYVPLMVCQVLVIPSTVHVS